MTTRMTLDQHIDLLSMRAEDARYLGDDDQADRLERRAAGLLKRREVAEGRIGYAALFNTQAGSAGNWR